MGLLNLFKLAAGSILGIIILALLFFGGSIGCIVAIAKGQALMAVASLLIPAFGAIYTIVSALQGIF